LHISLLSLVYFALILGIMILVHEFGHFAAAKLCGIRVEAFAIGFGKRIIGYKAKSGTDYRLNLLPLGGYVKMTGEMDADGIVTTDDSAPKSDSGNFNAKPRWQRICVALAGPFANFILSLVVLLAVGLFHHEVPEGLQGAAVVDYVTAGSAAAKTGVRPGDTILHYDTVERPTWEDVFVRSMLNLNQTVPFSYAHNGQRTDAQLNITSPGQPSDFSPDNVGFAPRIQLAPIRVNKILPDSPAEHAGLHAGDDIDAIDGLHLHSVPSILAYLRDQNGKPAVLTILREGKTIKLPVQPAEAETSAGHKQFRLGFGYQPPPVTVQKLGFADALSESWKTNKKNSLLIFDVLRGMFARRVSVKALSGPVGIFQEVDTASHIGFWTVMEVAASISLNLGIFNLLPFPILDGGMIVFLLIESLIRRDVNQVLKERMYQGAFIVIVLFAAFVIFNDISKFAIFNHVK